MANYSKYKNVNTVFGGQAGIVVPSGTTAERLGTATPGTVRYNTDLGLLEQYNALGWQSVDAPPTVTNISGTINENTNSTITITGSNFKTGAIISIEGAAVGGIPRQLSSVFVSTSTMTAATNATAVNYVGGAAFDIKVVNPSGLGGTLSPAGIVDRDPVWSTSAGTIATIFDAYGSYNPIVTLSAVDPDGSPVTYSLTSGSLPAGTAFNTSTGAISGDPTDVSTSTSYTFTVTATSNGQSIARSFTIIVNPALDGSSAAKASTGASAIKTLTGTNTNGLYWIQPAGYSTAQQMYCIMDSAIAGGGWTLAMNYIPSDSSAWGGVLYYGNSRWDTQDGSFNTGNGLPTNQKTSAYGYLAHSQVLFIMHNVSNTNWRGYGHYTYTSSFQNKTLWQLISSETARDKIVTSGGRTTTGGSGSGITANDRRPDDNGLGGDVFIDGTVGGYNMANFNLMYRASSGGGYGWAADTRNDTRITTTAAQTGAGDGQTRGHHWAGIGIDHGHSGYTQRVGSSGSLSYCDGNHYYGTTGSGNYAFVDGGSNAGTDSNCTNGWEHGTLNIGHAIFVK